MILCNLVEYQCFRATFNHYLRPSTVGRGGHGIYKGHSKNNAHYFFFLTHIFYFRQYLFTVLLCSLPSSQWPSPSISEDLLFHLAYHFYSVLGTVQVTAAETPSKEEKRCLCMGSFILGNKSKSGGLMSGLYDGWDNAFYSYVLSKSVTTFTRCGHALSCKMSGPSSSQSGQFLCIFLRSFCIQSW